MATACHLKAFHRGRVPVAQQQPEVGMWDAADGAAGMRFAPATGYTALSDGPTMEKRGHDVCGMNNVRRNRRGV